MTEGVETTLNPSAAERVEDVGLCQYGGCEQPAEYRVEMRGGDGSVTFLCCDDCSREHRIWVVENDLLDHDISDAAREGED